jgi:hypothetical protein
MPRTRPSDCIKSIASMVKKKTLTDVQANEITMRMDRLARQRMATKNIKLDAALKEIEGEILAGLKFEQKVNERNRLLTIKAKRDVTAYVEKFKTPGEGLQAYLEGGLQNVEGARLSVDYRARSLYHQYFGGFTAELEKAGLIKAFRSGKLDKAIYQELSELNSTGGKPGSSGSAEAQQIASAYNRVHKDMVARQNRAGAYIQQTEGYVMRQTHDTGEIQKLGRMPDGSLSKAESFKKWYATVLPLIDHAKTFKGLDPKDFMEKVHEGLYTGVHGKPADEAEVAEFFAHGSLARSASAHRVLHFKDSNSAFQYNQMFGTKNFSDGVLSDLLFRSRNIVMMESFGPNPKETFDSLLRDLSFKARESDDAAKQVKSLSDWRLHTAWAEVSGSNEYPQNITLDKVSSGIRTITQLSKMGGVVLSSLGDKAFIQSEMSFQGMSSLQTMGKQFSGMINRSTDQKALLHHMGIGLDAMIGNTISRYTIHTTGTGTLHKIQQKFYDLNFMNWWNDTHKSIAGELMAAHLASNAGKQFADITPELAQTLKLYGIEHLEWEALRQSTEVAPNGENYMTTSSLKNIPDSSIDALVLAKNQKVTPASRTRMRDSLEEKLRVFFVDRIDIAVPTPGAAERKFLNFGTQAGTPLGETLRLLTMFKSFPLTVTRKIGGREVYRNNDTFKKFLMNDHQGKFRLAQLIAMTTVGGYLSGVVKDAIKGRNPKPLVTEDGNMNWKAINQAFLRGGGAGILGDFLFTEYDRNYTTFTGAMAGPVFGQLDMASQGFSKLIRGEDPTNEFSKTLLSNTPFINLFYIRPILDYFIIWNIQEMTSPGYVDRMAESVDEQQGFFIDPRDRP